MSKAICTSKPLLCYPNTRSAPLSLAPFLLPTFSLSHHSPFSTSTPLSIRQPNPHKRRRHGNPHRGESALRRTGLRYPVGMSKEPLPVPVVDPARRTKVQGDPKHGLWGFFNTKKEALTTPEEDHAHGRPWTVEELRHKSWEDLHSLWYLCCKEHNRMATERIERTRLKLGVGGWEAKQRTAAIRRTQQSIKHALTERWYAWEAAWRIAENDPEVNLNADPDAAAYAAQVYEGDAPKAAAAAAR